MVDRTPRREIKLKITQPEPRAALKPQYVYRWDRIFGALTALVLLMALVGYGLYAWLSPSPPPASVEAEEVPAQEMATAEIAQQPEGAVQKPVPSQSASAPEITAEDQETAVDSPAMPAESPGIETDSAQSPVQPKSAIEGPSYQAVSDPLRLAEAESPPAEIAEPVPAPVSVTDALPGKTPEAEPIVAPATAQTLAGEEIAEPESALKPAGEGIAEPEPGPIGTAKKIAEPALALTPTTEEIAEPETAPTRAAGEIVELEAGQTSAEKEVAEPKPEQTSGSETDVQDPVQSSAKTQPGVTGSESSAISVPTAPVDPGQDPVPEPESDTDTDTEAAPADSPEEEAREGLFRSPKVSISSPAVKRFVLAQSVSGKAPQGSLADITMSSKGYAPVSVFSEVTDLQGKVLEYRWLHDGKRVLRIRVPVGGKRWRSHTTKNIYKRMKGAWRIELRDSAGQLLASGDFVF